MHVFLAGMEGYNNDSKYNISLYKDTKVLVSFFYVKETTFDKIVEKVGIDNILLDSGAFTFRMQTKQIEDINSYTKRYVDFINKHDVKYFFEMDIDKTKEDLIQVKNLRKFIESKTGKQCIPVWHINRGIEEWKDLVEHYNYIAIGGITSKTNDKFHNAMRQMVHYANSKKVKVHGLGYIKPDILDIGFYSVDATTWNGGKFGEIFYYDSINNKPKRYKLNTYNNRIKTEKQKDLVKHNYIVWYKYQKYMRDKGFWKA